MDAYLFIAAKHIMNRILFERSYHEYERLIAILQQWDCQIIGKSMAQYEISRLFAHTDIQKDLDVYFAYANGEMQHYYATQF